MPSLLVTASSFPVKSKCGARERKSKSQREGEGERGGVGGREGERTACSAAFKSKYDARIQRGCVVRDGFLPAHREPVAVRESSLEERPLARRESQRGRRTDRGRRGAILFGERGEGARVEPRAGRVVWYREGGTGSGGGGLPRLYIDTSRSPSSSLNQATLR